MPSCYHHPNPNWTLTSLIGSYLDLALAYLLLIGSTLAFVASKFLSLFGLELPCPCADGLFGSNRIDSVHGDIRTRFPFNVMCDDGEDRVVVGNQVPPVMGRIRRRRVRGSRKGKLVSISPQMCLSWGKEGFGDNFGVVSENGKNIIEDGVSMVGEATPVTKYWSVEHTSFANPDVHASNENTELIMKNLERELEEVQAAHAALYLELEKERSAAATAADEAMAMILRLQSEKAVVEMESRQYQRMIDEKSAYDEEEMEILKEIIVRRERERHVLEKEVESYREMILSGEITREKPLPLFDSSDDTSLILKTICESIGKKGKYSKMKWASDECNMEFQEKGMVTVEVYPCGNCHSSNLGEDAIRHKLDEPDKLEFCKEFSLLSGQEDEERETKIETRIPDQNEGRVCSNSSQFETQSSFLDVHVIDDEQNLGVEKNGKESNVSKVECASAVSGKSDVADELLGTPVTEQNISRICSDMTKGGELMDTLSDSSSQFDLRRSSMSAIDSERFKLETEVEISRKRLKTIQKGRENLSFSLEYKEKESFQLHLLEEIASQLQAIRKINEPGISVRQGSLPPLSSKATSKKRRCHSVSLGLHLSA